MSTLAAVLVRQHAVPLETVEQAMLRQSLFGGDLATNILELGSIDEQSLLASTAATLDVPAVDGGRIANVDAELLAAFSSAQLLEHPFLPIASTATNLILAVSTPLPTSAMDELENRFGKPVVLRAALEVRIRQALAVALGQPLDERMVKLVASLDGEGSTTSAKTGDTNAAQSGAGLALRRSLPAGKISLLPLRRDTERHGPPHRLGPISAAMAEIELASAQSPGNVIAVWLDFASQYFDYTAVFAIQGDIAAGKAARGPGTTGEAFSRIGVPLDLPSALQRARAAASWQLIALEPRGLDRTLARDLGRPIGPSVLLLPLCIRQRVVLLTYGDHGDDDVSLDRVGDVLALKPLVERHLERLLVERKRGGRSLQPPGPAARASASERKVPVADQPAAGGAPPAVVAETPSPHELIPSQRKLSPTTDPFEGRTVQAPAGAPGGASIPAMAAAHPSSTVDTGTIDDSWDLIQPVLNVGDSEASRNVRAATNNPSAQLRDSIPPDSGWATTPTRPGLIPKLELLPDSEVGDVQSSPSDSRPNPPLSPAMRAEAQPAPTGLRQDESKELPVPPSGANEDHECLGLLERFKQGDVSALAQLIAIGDPAASLLARSLPGPVVTPSRAPRVAPSTKASDSGPVLKALVALGPVARPHVIARTSAGDPKVRVWAIRLLGELTGWQSAIAVAERIVLDRDAEVRRATYLASQQLLRDPDSAAALRQALLITAADRQAVITQRLAAIDAIADLRDSPSIPSLIELLGDPNPGTAAAAQQALTVLARQDFGYDAKTWTTWWNNNASRDRIEWVIDALDHRLPGIRQAASEELRLISRLYVGNFDDDSIEARAKIQKKYRDWWAAGGRSPSHPTKS